MKKFIFLFLIIFYSCKNNKPYLKPVSYAQFEEFVNETKYITDAERYGWSIIQIDVANFRKGTNANWKKPNGVDVVSSTGLPVTQVSYNDAKAYCNWANKRLPTYDEYWEIVKNDHRTIVSENILPISNVDEVNIIGNVWDITEIENKESVRLAGGSLFCSVDSCLGTVKDR